MSAKDIATATAVFDATQHPHSIQVTNAGGEQLNVTAPTADRTAVRDRLRAEAEARAAAAAAALEEETVEARREAKAKARGLAASLRVKSFINPHHASRPLTSHEKFCAERK